MRTIEPEVWDYIDGHNGKYQISTLGNIRSLCVAGHDSLRAKDYRTLKPQMRNGYQFIGLRTNGSTRFYKIHRLVASAFIANPQGLPVINHKDENKTNNRVENLEWCDFSYNNAYGSRPLRQAQKLGHPVLQLSKGGDLIEVWESMGRAGKCLHVSKSSISECCSGKRRSAGEFLWRKAT
jgi:hypothetical protein